MSNRILRSNQDILLKFIERKNLGKLMEELRRYGVNIKQTMHHFQVTIHLEKPNGILHFSCKGFLTPEFRYLMLKKPRNIRETFATIIKFIEN